jgi:hypothetical protein
VTRARGAADCRRGLAQLAGACAAACLGFPAAAQTGDEVLVVKLDSDDQGRMAFYWKDAEGQSAKAKRILLETRQFKIPGKYTVGTIVQGPTNSTQEWQFLEGFSTKLGIDEVVSLPSQHAVQTCYHPDTIKKVGDGYNTGTDPEYLFTGILWFGHVRAICKLKKMALGEKAAEKQRRRLATILADRSGKRFFTRLIS